MIDFATLRKADNHRGFNVERLTPGGWTAVNGQPFAERSAAESYLAMCDPADGEVRVYPALAARRVVPEPWPLVA
jgi:hypothetical protein